MRTARLGRNLKSIPPIPPLRPSRKPPASLDLRCTTGPVLPLPRPFRSMRPRPSSTPASPCGPMPGRRRIVTSKPMRLSFVCGPRAGSMSCARRRQQPSGSTRAPCPVRPGPKPTRSSRCALMLASQGIDKHLAHQGRILGRLSDEKFEQVVADARDKVSRAVRNAVREVEILQERESYRSRTEQGGTVANLKALAASGYRAGVICPNLQDRPRHAASSGPSSPPTPSRTSRTRRRPNRRSRSPR